MAKKVLTIKTKYGSYKSIFEPEPDMGGYMITVPQRPDVVSWGKTTAHAKKMAKEAIECSVEGEIIIEAERRGEIAIKKQRAVL
jgi:predicted RNase H-like HicB family nuclease